MTEIKRLTGDGLLQTYEIVNEEDYHNAEQNLLTSQTTQIKEEYGKQIEIINSSLPSLAEQFTWAMQLTEAFAWQNASQTKRETMQLPLIDALCITRGQDESREELIGKILLNYQSYVNQIAPILGQQKQQISSLTKKVEKVG